MNLFVKYSVLLVVIQVFICIVLGIIGLRSPAIKSLFDYLLYIYYPVIFIIWKAGRFRGESAMIEPIILGIPLGILIYGVVLGFIITRLKSH